MDVVTLIPWRAGKDARRRQLWDWTRPFLEELEWPIFEGDDGGQPFSRAGSINAAAEKAGNWDVAFIGDADTIQELAPARRAAERAFESGIMVVPWTRRYKLSNEGTFKCVQQGPENYVPQWNDRRDRTSQDGGGATIVISREAWDEVGGFDERFRGYGNEDLAFVAAVDTLVGPVVREEGTAWHLWHRTQPNVGTVSAATPANRKRWTEYQHARGNINAMRELIAR